MRGLTDHQRDVVESLHEGTNRPPERRCGMLEWKELHQGVLNILLNCAESPLTAQYLHSSGGLGKLLHYMETMPEPDLVEGALGVVARLANTELGRDMLHKNNMEKELCQLLREDNSQVTGAACLGIALMTHNRHALAVIVKENPVKDLLLCLKNESRPWKSRQSAAHALCELLRGDKKMSITLLENKQVWGYLSGKQTTGVGIFYWKTNNRCGDILLENKQQVWGYLTGKQTTGVGISYWKTNNRCGDILLENKQQVWGYLTGKQTTGVGISYWKTNNRCGDILLENKQQVWGYLTGKQTTGVGISYWKTNNRCGDILLENKQQVWGYLTGKQTTGVGISYWKTNNRCGDILLENKQQVWGYLTGKQTTGVGISYWKTNNRCGDILLENKQQVWGYLTGKQTTGVGISYWKTNNRCGDILLENKQQVWGYLTGKQTTGLSVTPVGTDSYSSPTASLMLNDSSLLTSDSQQLGIYLNVDCQK
uniref:Uncharacterized protein n=1 Tax=Timema bartmani TaxID=61472 RepID=A0A7R9I535_9NEOP|nr:unnamed protein product [Timema bartmani]